MLPANRPTGNPRPEIPRPQRNRSANTNRAISRTSTTSSPYSGERTDGTNVWDVDGNRFLDLTSAFGVAGLGHTNPEIKAAIAEQSAKMFHAMGDVHPAAEKARALHKN